MGSRGIFKPYCPKRSHGACGKRRSQDKVQKMNVPEDLSETGIKV